MIWFLTGLLLLGAFVAIELIRPKPQLENARPAGLGDFNFPTATEGRAVPLIWGTVRLRSPNVVWWGNFRSTERTQKVKTGLFSSQDVVIGYKYYVGMHMALCLGPVDAIEAIWIKDRNLPGGRTSTGSLGVNSPGLMGGENEGGGFQGQGYWYAGGASEPVDTYLDDKITGPVPAYRGICHYVWRGGYVGTSTNIPVWAFELRRQPDGLNLAAYDPGAEAPNTYDCNLMNAIYEVMTNTAWGLGISSSKIDIPNFQAAGSTLAGEGNGVSMIVDSEKGAHEVLKEFERQADGRLYFSRDIGKWRISLARDDYDPGTLTVYDENNIIKLHNYARTTWEETSNEVRLEYIDRDDDYKQKYAFAQDSANNIMQGGAVAATVRYPGVKNATLANKLAWDNLRTLSYPLAKVDFETTRFGFDLVPGSVFKFNWTRLGVTGLVFRATKIDYGNIDNGSIRVQAIQDIFSVSAGSFAVPPSTGWTEPLDDYAVVTAADTLVFEAPRQMVVKDPWDPEALIRLWHGCRYPGGNVSRMQLYLKQGAGTRPLASSYETDVAFANYLLRSTLKTAIPAYYGSAQRPATQYIVLNNSDPDDLTELIGVGNVGDVESLRNIVWMNGEFIGFEEVDESGGDIRLTKLHRGLFNTAPKAHAVDTDVWFISQGGALSRTSLTTTNDLIDTQLRSQNRFDESTEGETPVTETDLAYLYRMPNPPRDPVLNTVYADATSVSLDTAHTSETGYPTEDSRGILLTFTPRGFRVTDITQDDNLDLSSPSFLSDSPQYSVVLTMDPTGTPAAVPAYVVSGADAESPEVVLLRTDIITAVGSNTAIPSDAKLVVETQHDPIDITGATTYTNPVDMEHEFTVATSLTGTKSFGGFTVNTASDAVVLTETGTYTFNIYTALPASGIVEIQINSGGWNTLIGAAATSNTVAITANDSVELRFTQNPANPQFFSFAGPTSETGYGVFDV